MVRILIFFALIAAAALGLGALIEQPGALSLTWFGYHIDTSPLVGIGAVALAAVIVWIVLSFIFNIPGLISIARRARRNRRGHEALARGILAAGVGDARGAQKASHDAKKLLPQEPLTLLLEAQAAQLAGDRAGATRVFRAMTDRSDTKLLGLRGLHAESLRLGDQDGAHRLALEAQSIAPLAWSGQAVLDRYTSQNDWEAARLCVEQNLRAKVIDKETANRQRAVLDTATAMECELTDPDRAIKLLRAAVKKVPDLVPAVALLGRLLSRQGEMRAASKMIEAAYAKAPHPNLARAYIDMRPGDSSADKLARAKTLAKLAPSHPESAMMVAEAALAAREFATAREAMAPFVASGERPTARMCVIMAEIEDREHDAQGLVREWLSRASRAPRDPVWVADGHFSKHWAPVSPVTGKLDAYRWMQPKEELTGPVEEPPPAYEPPPPLKLEEAPEAAALPPAPNGAAEEKAPEAEAPPPQEAAPPPPEQTPPPSPEAAPPPQEPPPPSPPRPSTMPQAVIFPLPNAPDDPGPKHEEAAQTRLY